MRPVGSVLKMPNLDIIFGGRQRLRYSMTGAFVLASSPGRPDTASGNYLPIGHQERSARVVKSQGRVHAHACGRPSYPLYTSS